MRKSLLFAVFAASTAVIVPTRLLTASQYLFSWDSVNFALGMDDLDIVLHRPHPPGYVGFVVAGRMIRLLGADANLSMVLWNILLSILTCVVLFAFSYEVAPTHRERRAWIAWAIIIPSPLFWFYTSVAEIYVSEMFFTLLIAYFSFRTLRGEQAYLCPLLGALALSGAFKQSAMLLMLPLVAYTVVKAPVGNKRRAAWVFLASLSLWLVPLVWSQGLVDYVLLFWRQFAEAGTSTSPLISGDLTLLNRNLRDTLYALMVGIGLVNCFAVVVILATRAYRSAESSLGRDVMLLWAVPYGMVFVFVHFAKFGYALPVVPIACLALASVYGQIPYRRVVSVLLVAHWILGAWHFAIAQPATGNLIGEGMRYRDKSVSQKALTEFNSLLRPTLHTIREADADVTWTRRQIASLCMDEDEIVIVSDGGVLNGRRAMYYFPRARTVFPSVSTGLILANNRRLEIPDPGDVVLSASCRTFWMISRSHALVAQLSNQVALEEVAERDRFLFWTSGSVTVAKTAEWSITVDED